MGCDVEDDNFWICVVSDGTENGKLSGLNKRY